MPIIDIEHGALASSKLLNDNFHSLHSDIQQTLTTLESKVATLQSQLESKISSSSNTLLNDLYPIGGLYFHIGELNEACPLTGKFGTWEKLPADRVLQTAGIWSPGTQVPQGLPDHNHPMTNFMTSYGGSTSAILTANAYQATSGRTGMASATNSVYSESHGRVQPYAYTLNAWRRIA